MQYAENRALREKLYRATRVVRMTTSETIERFAAIW